jgi:hypothetical protein
MAIVGILDKLKMGRREQKSWVGRVVGMKIWDVSGANKVVNTPDENACCQVKFEIDKITSYSPVPLTRWD